MSDSKQKPQNGQPLNDKDQQIANDSNGNKAYDEPKVPPSGGGGSRLHQNDNNEGSQLV